MGTYGLYDYLEGGTSMFIRNTDTCPECGSEQTRIWEKRVKYGRVVRGRECLVCRHRYKTIEVDYDALKPSKDNFRDICYDMLNAGYDLRDLIEGMVSGVNKYEEND